jgi:hypothetical protein
MADALVFIVGDLTRRNAQVCLADLVRVSVRRLQQGVAGSTIRRTAAVARGHGRDVARAHMLRDALLGCHAAPAHHVDAMRVLRAEEPAGDKADRPGQALLTRIGHRQAVLEIFLGAGQARRARWAEASRKRATKSAPPAT